MLQCVKKIFALQHEPPPAAGPGQSVAGGIPAAMRVIKKYSNRRLYDTTDSRYVNLDELAALIRKGEVISVQDASSGEDLTRPVLLQVIMEAQGGADVLPVGLLHRMIRFGGEGAQSRWWLAQIGAGMALLDQQLMAFERQSGWVRPDMPPPEAAPPRPAAPPPAEQPRAAAEPAAPASAGGDEEMDGLRARLAALEERLRKKN
jgi:polyhydroxyalkanoate synthesis repressor PhaR